MFIIDILYIFADRVQRHEEIYAIWYRLHDVYTKYYGLLFPYRLTPAHFVDFCFYKPQKTGIMRLMMADAFHLSNNVQKKCEARNSVPAV